MVSSDEAGRLSADEARQLSRTSLPRAYLPSLRQIPEEWHKRGMLDPASLEAIASERLDRQFPPVEDAVARYSDFLANPM